MLEFICVLKLNFVEVYKLMENGRRPLVNSYPKRIMVKKNITVKVSINKNNEHPKISLEIIFFTDLSK